MGVTSVWKRNLRTACRSGKYLRSAYKKQTEKHTPKGFITAQQAKQTSKPKPTDRHSLIVWPERRNCSSCMQSALLVHSRSPRHAAVCSALLPRRQESCCAASITGLYAMPCDQKASPLSSGWMRNKAYSQPSFLNAFSLTNSWDVLHMEPTQQV